MAGARNLCTYVPTRMQGSQCVGEAIADSIKRACIDEKGQVRITPYGICMQLRAARTLDRFPAQSQSFLSLNDADGVLSASCHSSSVDLVFIYG